MTEKIQRCAIYIRVSTVEQQMHGKSLDAQKQYLINYANEHNMTVTGIYADEGKTARKEFKKRKAIHSLLEAVKHQEIDIILFWKMDRWFRSVADFYKVQDVLDEHGVTWLAVAEPNINMETRDGRLQLNLYLSIGQNEVDTTSERIKFVNEASVKQGRLIFGEGNMPLGYKIGTVDGVKRMVKDEKTEHIANSFFEYFRKHQNKSATVRYIQETYGYDFSYAMLKTMLSSEFYKGTYRNFPYCPAYLSEDEWNEVQQISKKNIKSTPSGRVYYFSGMMRCPYCGQLLCGTGCTSIINRKTGEKRTYCYYRCNRALVDKICKNRHRTSQNLLEKWLLDNLEKAYQDYLSRLKETKQKEKKDKKKRSPEKIKSEMERLNILFQKDRVKWDYYNKEYSRLEKELGEISLVTPTSKSNFSPVEDLFRSGSDFHNKYESLTPDNRQAFWRSIISEIHLNDDYTIRNIDFF